MQLLPFLAVAAVVVVTPGVNMALVTKNALLHGRRRPLPRLSRISGAARLTRPAAHDCDAGDASTTRQPRRFRQGLVSNLLNSKIAVFFTSFLPQFVGTHRAGSDLLLLGALFNAMGLVWLLSYALLAARGRKVLGRPSVKRTLDRVSGLVLIGLGIRIAFERRH